LPKTLVLTRPTWRHFPEDHILVIHPHSTPQNITETTTISPNIIQKQHNLLSVN
jgi:hypothetical protein